MTVPSRVTEGRARVFAAQPELEARVHADRALSKRFDAILLASNALTRLLLTDPLAIASLAEPDERVPFSGASLDDLAAWKQRELLRIAGRDLTGTDALVAVGAALSTLADDVLRAATRLTGTEDLVVIAMGKLAGCELNYASDIDILFCGDADDAAAREVMAIARRCFRVDANLRPEGRSGALVRSLDAYVRYWQEWAQPWEFQALLKARPVTGPAEQQAAWNDARNTALWGRRLDAEAIRTLRDLKAQSELFVRRRGVEDREVKRGRGGIRDVEFSVQLLQLVHGHEDEQIRSANTLDALHALAGAYIDDSDAETLGAAYRFLRAVEHRLQLVEDQQTHTIASGTDERAHLAATMGFRSTPEESAVEAFDTALRTHRTRLRSAHEHIYFRPVLDAVASARPLDALLQQRLEAFGFREAQRTREAIRELTHGLNRSSQLMTQLLPLLLDWLSRAPDPDAGLLGLRKVIDSFHTPEHVVRLIRDDLVAAQRLCLLLGTGPRFVDAFSQHRRLISDLGKDDQLVPTGTVVDRLRLQLEWQPPERRADVRLRFVREEEIRTAAADVLQLDEDGGARRRTELVDAVLHLAFQDDPPLPMAIFALGRYGGQELSYASDADVIVVHAGTSDDDQARAEAFVRDTFRTTGSPVPLGALMRFDFDLRPEGRNGPLVRSLRSYEAYWKHWAASWERQALLRMRWVGGDQALADRFTESAQSFVFDAPLDEATLRSVRQLKARMEVERIPRGQDGRLHLKLGPGGLTDVEWTVQRWQWEQRVGEPNTLRALRALRARDLITAADATALEEAWRFCDRARNGLALIGAPADVFPAQPHRLAVLARVLDIDAASLREQHLAVTRRARSVTRRLFYGGEDD